MAVSKDNFPSSRAMLEEFAREHLGETEEQKQKCLRELRDLIKNHKVTCCSTDDFLLRFLRRGKFNTKKSFQALRNYVCQRRLLHKKLVEIPPERMENCFRQHILGFLPNPDAKERRIYFINSGHWNWDICTIDEVITAFFLLANHTSEVETTQITGVVPIFDLRSTPLINYVYIMRHVNRWRSFMFNCVPARYPIVHVISNSATVNVLRSLIIPFFPKKLKERLVFHRNEGETLFEHIPSNILPERYGGTLEQLDTESITKTMMDYYQQVKDEYHYYQEVPECLY